MSSKEYLNDQQKKALQDIYPRFQNRSGSFDRGVRQAASRNCHGTWVSSEEIVQLAVAQRTALLTSFVLMAVNLVVAPRFASMYKKGEMK